MKTVHYLPVVLLLAASLFMPSLAKSQPADTNWSSYNQSLVQAMQSSVPTQQLEALKKIILHAEYSRDSLQVSQTVPSIMAFYQAPGTSKNLRMMALTALHHLQPASAMQWVEQQLDVEPSIMVRRHICRLLESYYAGPGNKPDKAAYYRKQGNQLYRQFVQQSKKLPS